MIKRIQLRGISRNPSDRMTEDGGVADSINMCVKDGEQAPMVMPVDVTESEEQPEEVGNATLIYLHKTRTGNEVKANYIYKNGYQIGTFSDGEFESFVTIGNNTDVTSITSVGNTIIITTDNNMYYVLYKDSEYRFLGNRIPTPTIRFKTEDLEDESGRSQTYLIGDDTGQICGDLKASNEARGYTLRRDETISVISEMLRLETTFANELIKLSKPVYPQLVRFTVRLYNGESYATSSPVLMGALEGEYPTPFKTYIGYKTEGETPTTYTYSAKVQLKRTIHMNYVAEFYSTNVFEGWEDIVSSVDIYTSLPIKTDIDSTKCQVLEERDDSEEISGYNKILKLLIDPLRQTTEFGNLLDTYGSEFHLLKSISLWDYKTLQSYILEAYKCQNSDQMAVQPSLTSEYKTNHKTILSKVGNYNNSLLGFGGSRTLCGGHKFGQSLYNDGMIDNFLVKYKYYLSTADGDRTVLGISTDTDNPNVYTEGTTYAPYAYLSYPDSRCYKVEISTRNHVRSFEMKANTAYDYSYCYYGFGKRLDVAVLEGPSGYVSNDENNIENLGNRFFQTEPGDIFRFPAGGIQTFSGEVQAFAVATKPLSIGQFGQYPVYVFTTEGIYAMSVGDDGKLLQNKPTTMDICINPDGITNVDQAVVFLTESGLKIMTGMDIQDLTQNVIGEPVMLDDEAVHRMDESKWEGAIKANTEGETLMSFLKGAKCVYDYPGKRLLFFNGDYDHQMVFYLETSTWHKMMLPQESHETEGETEYDEFYEYHFSTVINYYPFAYVVFKNEDNQKIVDFSTNLSNNSADKETMKSIVVTRAISFGEDDILKSLSHLKIRGHYQRFYTQTDEEGNVSYVLNDNGNPIPKVSYIIEGSQDGINWHKLSSLRGKSWKLFRIVILADLNADERISWIDAEYDTRETNKFR